MLLVLDGVVAGYRQPVTAPVSFALAAGEVLGLRGPNGGGKSTLLRAITGQARCFAGRITVAAGHRIALQQQHPVRLAEMPLSVADYLALQAVPVAGLPPRLAALAGARLDTLSGGQFQLLCLWAVLASAADVVILDEPTNNLDPAGVDLLAGWLQQRPATRGLLVVSHEAEFLAQVCTREIVLPIATEGA